MIKEEFRKDLVSIGVEPQDIELEIGQTASIKIIIKVNSDEILSGGSIRIGFPGIFANPQFSEPGLIDYCSATCSRQGTVLSLESYSFATFRKYSYKRMLEILELDRRKRAAFAGRPYGSLKTLFIDISGESLHKGDEIILHFGDRQGGGAGISITEADRCTDYAYFTASVDPDGMGKAPYSGFYVILPQAKLKIRKGSPALLDAVVPSIAPKGINKIKMQAYSKNLEPADLSTCHFKLLNGKIISEKRLDIRSVEMNVDIPSVPITRVSVLEPERKLITKTNPSLRTQINGYNIYWGDIHGKTRYSDGNCEWLPSDYYQYARDVAHLDFSAVSDHDAEMDYLLSAADWEDIKNAGNKYNQPGKFVTLLGYEYTNRVSGGDRNIYFRGNDGEVFHWDNPESNNPEKLWKKLKKYDCITIPHHPAHAWLGTRWEHVPPVNIERLVEIFSAHGNSECSGCRQALRFADYINGSVQAALAKGYRLGIIASGDIHSVRLGFHGKAAVFAKSLSRENIWDALYQRRCYGTTGARIILDFKIDETMMGDSFSAHDKPLQIKTSVYGTDRIRKVELLRNNQVIHSITPDAEDVKMEYIDSSRPRQGTFYYLRVLQEDEHMAWSSPIWID